jgi:uncharacterized membrane protein
MSKIVRHEFLGNWLYFWLMCITGVLIPVALLYLLNGTVRVETEMDDPERCLQALRRGR